MTPAEFFAEAHAALAGAGSISGAFTGTYQLAPAEAVSVRGFRNDGEQRVGQWDQGGVPRITLELSLADVPQPAPGAVVVADGVSYTLDSMTDRVAGSHTVWTVL